MLISEYFGLTSAEAMAYVGWVLDSPRQIVAHLAATIGICMIAIGAFVRTMAPLRWLAAGSNVGLVLFGALHPSPITLIIAGVLLPINIYRAVEVMRLSRQVSRAEAQAETSGLWLKPYMKSHRLPAGETLFQRGDRADRLFLLAQGELELVEIGESIETGRIFGEIGLFSPDRKRTHTVRCRTDCTVLDIHRNTVKQLYYQNPAFGFHLIALLAGRLMNDVARAQGRPVVAPKG